MPTPIEILQELIRFDTTNPPGNERPCIDYIAGLFRDAGLESLPIARDPDRPNLIARLPGRGDAPPLLLYGHVDVVPAGGRAWTHLPFEGRIADGFVWGRGSLDMKGGLAMMISALLGAGEAGVVPAGDLLFAALADEEAGGGAGARFLVEAHPELFHGVRYAIGEFGGFPLHIGDRTFYLIQVGEKRPLFVRACVRGPAGHGALPARGGTMARLARVLDRLDRHRFPIRIHPVVRRMVESIADELPGIQGRFFRRILDPRRSERVLDRLGETGRSLEPLLRDTVNATIVRGGRAPNVVPSEINIGLDARLLPDMPDDEFLDQLQSVVGDGVALSVPVREVLAPTADLGLFDALAGLLREARADAIPVPYLLPGSSDGRLFARLGIQTYGFTPMTLPPSFRFFETIHATDERIPVDAVEFGSRVIGQLIRTYDRTSIRSAEENSG